MKRLHSAWLARRLRRQRRRRFHSFVWMIGGVLAFMLLPLLLRSPTSIEEITMMKSLTAAAAKESLAKNSTCQEGTTIFAPEMIKGSGTYKLDHREGVQSAALSKNDYFGQANPSWAQYGQDLWVDTYFGQIRNGVFVEVGGFDGETHSNTLFLEKERGWQGVLIEANPYSFQLMRSKDRSCWMVNACIQSENHAQLHFSLAGGITSALELTSRQHSERIQHDLPKYRNQRNWEGAGEMWCVACLPFAAILDGTFLRAARSNQSQPYAAIDYFSLDVEGSELEILRALFDNRTSKVPTIRLFTIEMQESAHAIRQFMFANHYREIAVVGIDGVFVKESAVGSREYSYMEAGKDHFIST